MHDKSFHIPFPTSFPPLPGSSGNPLSGPGLANGGAHQREPGLSTSGNSSPSSAPSEDLFRVFNTALVATRAEELQDSSSELYKVMESSPFRAILNAVRQFARLQGISERQAAEQIIQTFRKVDRIWGEYVYQEGVDRLKNQLTSG